MGIAPLVILLSVMFIPILAIFLGLFLSTIIIAWGLFQRFRPDRLVRVPVVVRPVSRPRFKLGYLHVAPLGI